MSSSVRALVQGGCAVGSAAFVKVPSISKSHVFGISDTKSPLDVCVCVPVLGHMHCIMCFPVTLRSSASGRNGTLVKNLWFSAGGP